MHPDSTIALTNLETTVTSPLFWIGMHPTQLFSLGLEMLVSHSASTFNINPTIRPFGLTLGYSLISIYTPIAHEVCKPRIYSFINSSIQLLYFGYPRVLDVSLDSYPSGVATCFGYFAGVRTAWLGPNSAARKRSLYSHPPANDTPPPNDTLLIH